LNQRAASRTLSNGALEVRVASRHILGVTNVQHYQKEALRHAKVIRLGAQEGFVAKIPGFKGLLAEIMRVCSFQFQRG
jgi:hypothetical protein